MRPKYEDKMDSVNAICPYCGHTYQVEGEDYDESSREEECEACGKSYWIHQSFSVDTFTKPDCKLNGQKHVFEPWTSKNGKQEAFFCSVCGECSLTGKDED